MSKIVNRAEVAGNQEMAWTATIVNVRVCDRLPSGLVFVSSSPGATRSDRRYCWSLGTLAAKATKHVRVTVRALRGTKGKRTNTATVSGRGASARSDASPAVDVLAAAARGGASPADAGERRHG